MRRICATGAIAVLVLGLGTTVPALAVDTNRCRGVEATIVGTEGDDTLIGTDGDDVIVALGGIDVVSGGRGDDLICGGESAVRVDGDGYRIPQSLHGGPGDDRVFGGSGYDALGGDAGSDVLRAAAGHDEVRGGEGRDQLWGGLGDDLVEGNDGPDVLRGGPGDDELAGIDGRDRVHGGGGSDVLHGGAGDDLVDGGAGRDAAAMHQLWNDGSITGNRSDVRVDLRAGTARSEALGRDRLRSIEDVWTGSGEDLIIGDSGANLIYPGEWFGKGRDVVRAGAGSDTISFDPAITHGCCSKLTVDLARGRAWFGAGTLDLAGIENVVGQGDRDVLLGDAGDNVLMTTGQEQGSFTLPGMTVRGRGGDDLIIGSYRSDQLYGGPGDDAIRALGGDDVVDGNGGTNTIDGGLGVDSCRRPTTVDGATSCEG